MISKESLRRQPPPTTPNKALYRPSKQPLNCIGEFLGTVCHKDRTSTQNIFLVRSLKHNLLGLPVITALELVLRLDAAAIDTATNYCKKIPSLFKGLGNLGDPIEIHLKTGLIPHCLYTLRHIPLPLREGVKQELDRMESTGVIKKIDKPTQWCAGMVVVPKKEGKIRICVDLKPLNDCVLREIHPLPRVQDTLAKHSGAKYLSKLDANSGFWQIPLADKSQLLTTFITPFGHYHFALWDLQCP